MISALNQLVALVEEHLAEELDMKASATALGTTEYHLRRMFSSLAGMPLSEYVRRRRMTVAAADVVRGEDDLLSIAVRPRAVRRDGGPLRTQPQLRFRLTVEGSTPMDTRVIERPAFRLIGHAARVPLIYQGINPHIQQHIATLPQQEHARLKALSNTEPAGLLAVSDDLAPDAPEGSELTYLHGVAVTQDTPVPDDLDAIGIPAGRWAIFHSAGPYPQALQATWAATATEWFPANPWRLRPGPSILTILERAEDFTTATCELWLPVEPA
ncbi:GyrI-like domain-containing protein [Streptomyces sp. NPDC056149]|uniref:GyrI-like domain-containing protein n=1 Tax=Streptomyces sp. NPDC056149 TaxID=3345728 RepID=UPI0035DBB855